MSLGLGRVDPAPRDAFRSRGLSCLSTSKPQGDCRERTRQVDPHEVRARFDPPGRVAVASRETEIPDRCDLHADLPVPESPVGTHGKTRNFRTHADPAGGPYVEGYPRCRCDPPPRPVGRYEGDKVRRWQRSPCLEALHIHQGSQSDDPVAQVQKLPGPPKTHVLKLNLEVTRVPTS